MKIHIYRHPRQFQLPLDGPIYFRPEYSIIQDYEKPVLVQSENKKVSFPGVIKNKQLISLPRSPFGGVVTDDPGLFKDFMDAIEKSILTEIDQVTVTLPPSIYESFPGKDLYLDCGYTVLYEDFNQHLDLTQPINFHSMELRKLKKATQAELDFRNTDEIEKTYSFLSACRKQQGLEINIDQETFMHLFAKFPDEYRAWVVTGKGAWMAALVTVRVTKNITYYFLPGSDKAYNSLSPMVFLVYNLIKELRSQDQKILDMGVSSIKGKKQQGLFIFKERLGARTLKKPTVYKRIYNS